jgi:hypothetical protein
MAKVIDLTGKKFGRWFVEGLSHQKGKMLYWSCVCECGVKRAVFGADLKRGGSLSCGCLHREQTSARTTKHDMSFHPAYRAWIQMRSRCLNEKNTGFKDYGGRGIKVHAAWLEFDNFWRDMGPTWAEGLSLDRIEVNGHYEPLNCRWATPKEQGNNRRTNRFIKCPDGLERTVTEAAEAYGLNRNSLAARIRYGWSDEELFQPVLRSK